MASDAPLLSIVTPCLNAATHLPRALESVAGQPLPAGMIEHIVMDGGSTDGTRELIAGHASGHPRLVTHWRSEPDGGQSDAINKGLALARGTFGAWLNADDWYEPGALARLADILRDDPTIDVLVGRCRFVDAGGATVFAPRPPEPIGRENLLRLKSQWFNGRCLVQPEVVFRLSLFRAVGGLNPKNHHTMDYELWLRLLEAGARFVTADVPVACLGVHAGQKTADNRAVVRSILRVAEPAYERSADRLGSQAGVIRAELDSMRRKLHLADELIARWDGAAAPGGGEDPLAVAAYADAAAPHLAGWQAGRDALAAPHVEAVALAAARRLVLRRSLRIGVVTAGGTVGAAAVLGRLRRKRMRIALLGVGEAQVRAERERLAAVVGDGRDLSCEVSSGPQDSRAGPFDLLITEDFWVTRASPGEALARVGQMLRRSGMWAQLPEPRPVRTLGPYLARLRRVLADQLSRNDEVVLAGAADLYLRRVEIEAGMTGPAGLWSRAHPAGRGVDIEAEVQRVRAPLRLIKSLAFGGLHHHPLAPFPFVGPPALNAEHAWTVSLWKRV